MTHLHAVARDTAATLVDTCVLLDIFTDDPRWADWSSHAVATARDEGELVINPIVYSEISVGFDTIEALDEALPVSEFTREPLPYDAGFLAGKAYLAYRRQGGIRRSPLPDFSIGAHAAVARPPCADARHVTVPAVLPDGASDLTVIGCRWCRRRRGSQAWPITGRVPISRSSRPSRGRLRRRGRVTRGAAARRRLDRRHRYVDPRSRVGRSQRCERRCRSRSDVTC